MSDLLKPIDHYSDYLITRGGVVLSIKSGEPKPLKQTPNNHGYPTVDLLSKGKKKRFLVHRLVAARFVANPKHYPCVNHKDSNPQNNSADNLEWCTMKQNTNHAYSKGRIKNPPILHGEECRHSKLNNAKIKEIRKKRNKGATLAKLASEYKVHLGTISKICRGELWKHL